jgi:type IV pilus assembly protein PilB
MNIDVSKEAVSLIPGNKAFELNVLPIKIEEGMLHVGIADKCNQKLINELSFYTGYKILPMELRPEVILEKLKSLYGSSEVGDQGNESMTYNENQVTEYSNVEFVNQIIANAINSGASDIHFEVYEELFRVRYRIDGHLREIINLQKSRSLAIFSRLKIMANLDISEKRRPQDGRIRFQHNGRNIDIRVSTLPTSYGEKIVLRILDKSQLQLDVSKLGLETPQLEILLKSLAIPYGMILVTGPTGSGKTTTLYAALRQIH